MRVIIVRILPNAHVLKHFLSALISENTILILLPVSYMSVMLAHLLLHLLYLMLGEMADLALVVTVEVVAMRSHAMMWTIGVLYNYDL